MNQARAECDLIAIGDWQTCLLDDDDIGYRILEIMLEASSSQGRPTCPVATHRAGTGIPISWLIFP